MELTAGRHLGTDQWNRRHFAVTPTSADAVYNYNVHYWATRITDMSWNTPAPPWEVKEIIAGQIVTDTPYNKGERKKLKEIYKATKDFSMLELGAANGTVFERLGAEDFRYVGFEMMPEMAKDFKKKHKEAKVHCGDVSDFIKANIQPKDFTLFYAHVSLLMIKPTLVRKALAKAAAHCEQFLIYDFLDYPNHKLEEGEAVVFDMLRPEKWFAHPWYTYIDEIGFKIVDREIAETSDDPQYDNQLQGFGYIHAIKD